jgi:hypothetical protein
MADLTPSQTLQLETYKLLRAEIDQFCKSFDTYAISAVVATGTAWAWLLTHESNLKGHEVFYLSPSVCALFFGVRVYAIMRSVTELGSHLAKIERAFYLDKDSGWECYCEEERRKAEQDLDVRTGSLLGLWQWVFWVALIALNFIVGMGFAGGLCRG